MKFFNSLLLGALSVPAAYACSDDGDGRFNRRVWQHRQRAIEHHNTQALEGRSAPGGCLAPEENFRPLVWGDLNFVHVTDTHGWLTGHPDQDQYSADWGDFISFNEHLAAEADRRDVDFLVIETGDRHDGTGLSDSTEIDGSSSQLIFGQAPLDILSIGNHELYDYDDTYQEYTVLRPFYGENYLSSNVEIQINETWFPAGHRYRIHETKNRKFRVLTFGFLYNFTGNANGTRVTAAQEVVKQDWFQEVISRDDFDIILVTGHVPVRGFDEYDAVIDAIRAVKPHIPIQGFGGHTHIRDYRIFDDNAAALESGRYLETIGWASVQFAGNSTKNHTTFNRRYIDFSALNFAHHTNTSVNATGNETAVPFQTKKGLAVSQYIQTIRKQLKIDTELTYVDQDYWVDRAPYPSNSSLLSLTEEKVLPKLQGNVSRDDKPRFIMTNTGNFRYDLIKGPYTEDSKYIVSPFDDPWLYFPDVPIEAAQGVIDHLNNDYSYIRKRDTSLLDRINNKTTSQNPIPTSLPAATTIYIPPPCNTSANYQPYKGYATTDDAGSDGDDTPHIGYTFYDIPNAIQAVQNVDNSTKTADVIFVNFLESDILTYLAKHNYNETAKAYGGSLVRDLIAVYFESVGNSTSSN